MNEALLSFLTVINLLNSSLSTLLSSNMHWSILCILFGLPLFYMTIQTIYVKIYNILGDYEKNIINEEIRSIVLSTSKKLYFLIRFSIIFVNIVIVSILSHILFSSSFSSFSLKQKFLFIKELFLKKAKEVWQEECNKQTRRVCKRTFVTYDHFFTNSSFVYTSIVKFIKFKWPGKYKLLNNGDVLDTGKMGLHNIHGFELQPGLLLNAHSTVEHRCPSDGFGRLTNDMMKMHKYTLELCCDERCGDGTYLDNLMSEAWIRQLEDHSDIFLPSICYLLYTCYYNSSASSSSNGRLSKCDSSIIFKPYPLHKISKSFDNIFIPNKQRIIRIINDFIHQSGKFSMKGVPRKFTILLHGPPGTGKTSFIKSLIQHTNRHAIFLPLSKIQTNEDIRSVLINEFKAIQRSSVRFKDEMEVTYISLKHSQVIYVIEDVDCMNCKIIQKRNPIIIDHHQVSSSSSSSSYDNDYDDTNDNNNEKSKRKYRQRKEEKNDRLSLSELLNCFDGIIEPCERIIVMTTNHMDKIDPALLRPGRVDLTIHLDNITYEQMWEMVRYYQVVVVVPLDETQEQQSQMMNGSTFLDKDEMVQQRLDSYLHRLHKKISAAKFENICMYHATTIDEFVNALENECLTHKL